MTPWPFSILLLSLVACQAVAHHDAPCDYAGHRLPSWHFADQLAFLHRKIGTDAPVEADRVGPYPQASPTR